MKLPWLLVAASSSLACGLVCIQVRNLPNHDLSPVESLLFQPGAPDSSTVIASSTWVRLCDESMIPVPETLSLHGMRCAKFRFGFIAVAGLRNHVRMSSSARAAYLESPL